MSIGFMFIIIAIIVIFILQVNNHFSSNKFIKETEPYFRVLMEDDYEFLLKVRYGVCLYFTFFINWIFTF